MTVMDNLHRKGWLIRERDGRAWRYRAAGSRQTYAARLMNDVLATAPIGPVRWRSSPSRSTAADAEALARALDEALAQRRDTQRAAKRRDAQRRDAATP